MTPVRRHLQALLRLALVAALAVVVLPTVSRALQETAGKAAVWTEVCTMNGLQRMDLNQVSAEREAAERHAAVVPAPAHSAEPEAGSSSTGSTITDACAHCLLAATQLLPAGDAGPAAPPVSRGTRALPTTAVSPGSRSTWDAARPRGPPLTA